MVASLGVFYIIVAYLTYVSHLTHSLVQILVLNSNPDLVMVGCRVHVGNTSASHIPSELSVFQRSIRLEESVRCWYDIPFSNAEALLADEEFTLVIGPAFGGSSLPRIDSLEIYGRSKDEFGWKEKLEAALDLESPGQVGSALIQSSANRTKQKLMQNASPTEQLLSDSLLLLQSYYLACRVQFKAEFAPNRHEESRKLCMSVLDVVFENDRQPLLQSSARHVLRALYPGKDAYNQVSHPTFSSTSSAIFFDIFIREILDFIKCMCRRFQTVYIV